MERKVFYNGNDKKWYVALGGKTVAICNTKQDAEEVNYKMDTHDDNFSNAINKFLGIKDSTPEKKSPKQLLEQFVINCKSERVNENRTLYKRASDLAEIHRIMIDIPSFRVKVEWTNDERTILISRELLSFIAYSDYEMVTVICDSQYAYNDEFRKYKNCYE